jgi:WD40 repeat protein
VRLWDVTTGAMVRELSATYDIVRNLAFSPDGRLLAVTGLNGAAAHLFDPQTGEPVAELAGQLRPVSGVAFRPDGSTLVAVDDAGSVRLWNVDPPRLQSEVPQHSAGPSLLPGGSALATLVEGSVLRTQSLTDDAVSQVLDVADETDPPTRIVAVRGDGLVATTDRRAAVQVWNTRTARRLYRRPGHYASVTAAAFSPGNRFLVTADFAGTVRIWHAEDGKLLWKQDHPLRQINAMAFSPGGRFVAMAGSHPELTLLDLRTGGMTTILYNHVDCALAVAYSPRGDLIATGGRGGRVRLWQAAHRRVDLAVTAVTVSSLAFSPDGAMLAAATDGTVTIWRETIGGWTRFAELVPLGDGGFAAFGDGWHKTVGSANSRYWFAAGLCRIEPEAVDPATTGG